MCTADLVVVVVVVVVVVGVDVDDDDDDDGDDYDFDADDDDDGGDRCYESLQLAATEEGKCQMTADCRWAVDRASLSCGVGSTGGFGGVR